MAPNTPIINNQRNKLSEFPLTLRCKTGNPLHRCEQRPNLNKDRLDVTSMTSWVRLLTVPRIDIARAKVAFFDPHGGRKQAVFGYKYGGSATRIDIENM